MSRVLRPHHGMCFQFYEGKGYSEDFTDHMGRIIREMETEPSQIIKLQVGTDIVCENCANNEAGDCTTADKVKKYDEMEKALCNISLKRLKIMDFICWMSLKTHSRLRGSWNCLSLSRIQQGSLDASL